MSWKEDHQRKPFGERVLSVVTTLAIIVTALIILLAIADEVLIKLGDEPICTERGCMDPVR